jgi:hypothetical protein
MLAFFIKMMTIMMMKRMITMKMVDDVNQLDE